MSRSKITGIGDCEPVGDGLSEMRVFVGPGYGIYFVRTGIAAYLLRWGSDKTDQKRGIKRAKKSLMPSEVDEMSESTFKPEGMPILDLDTSGTSAYEASRFLDDPAAISACLAHSIKFRGPHI